MPTKVDLLTARLECRVAPAVLALVDSEIGRLRTSDFMFGNRKPKQAAIVMTAIKAFMSLPADEKDKYYEKYLSELTSG